MIKKKLWIGVLVLILTVAFSACGAENTTGEKSNSEKPLVVSVLPDTQSVPLIVAEHMGYFDEENIAVEIEAFTSAADRDSAIQSGAVDVMLSDLVAVALFRESGFDYQVIFSTDGSQQLLASPQSGITSVKDLQGQTLALSENTIMDYAADRILEANDVDKKTVEYTYIPQMTVRMEMLINSNVASAMMPEPQVSVAKEGGATVLASSEDLGLNATCVALSTEMIESESEVLRGFVAAYNKGVAYLNETDPEEYMDWVIKETGFPESVTDTLALPEYREAAVPTQGDVEDVMAWLTARGLIGEAMDYDTIVNSDFAR